MPSSQRGIASAAKHFAQTFCKLIGRVVTGVPQAAGELLGSITILTEMNPNCFQNVLSRAQETAGRCWSLGTLWDLPLHRPWEPSYLDKRMAWLNKLNRKHWRNPQTLWGGLYASLQLVKTLSRRTVVASSGLGSYWTFGSSAWGGWNLWRRGALRWCDAIEFALWSCHFLWVNWSL